MKCSHKKGVQKNPKIFDVPSGSVIEVRSKNFGDSIDCHLVTNIYEAGGEIVRYDINEEDISRAVINLETGEVFWASKDDACVMLDVELVDTK